jgi:chemotaxis protein CheZ
MEQATKRYRIEQGAADGRERAYRVSRGAAPACAPPFGQVQSDLHAMKDAIAMTKREIAALEQSATGRDGVHRAACELDAVAEATERATTTILGAVEEIENAANMLRNSGTGGDRGDYLRTILDRVVLLYETCNFQDVTGQRIEKVIGTMKFVEERLDRVIAVWGGDRFQPESAPVAEDLSGRDLATGPSLPDEVQVSQNEVDAFFR